MSEKKDQSRIGGGSPVSAPVADFSATPLSGQLPLTVNFTDTSTNTPTSWQWSINGTPVATTQNLEYIFTEAGNYTVSLIATNAGGGDTETKENYITVTEEEEPVIAPVANFSASPLSGQLPLTVNFTDTSTNTPTSWQWSINGTPVATTQNLEYIFTEAGNYTVSLIATNAGGGDTETKENYITVTEEEEPGSETLYANKAAAVADGCYVYYPAEESSGFYTEDIINSKTLTATNVSRQAGMVENSNYSLYHGYDSILVTNPENSHSYSTNKITCAFVLKRIASPLWQVITAFEKGLTTSSRLWLDANTGNIELTYNNDLAPQNLKFTADAVLSVADVNCFIMFDIDIVSKTAHFYKDGAEVTLTKSVDTGTPAQLGDDVLFGVGRRISNDDYKFSGCIDEIAVWKDKVISELAFTPAEHYNSGNGKLLFV
ncbi:MAG TPA: PKD domain-containing protein [bacterium]|nr:PKD domain-containing protein [bacterium]